MKMFFTQDRKEVQEVEVVQRMKRREQIKVEWLFGVVKGPQIKMKLEAQELIMVLVVVEARTKVALIELVLMEKLV